MLRDGECHFVRQIIHRNNGKKESSAYTRVERERKQKFHKKLYLETSFFPLLDLFVPSFIFHRLIFIYFLRLLSHSKTGFVCAMFYRRNAHVTELQMGTPATRLEDACTINHFDINRLPFITLLGKEEKNGFYFIASRNWLLPSLHGHFLSFRFYSRSSFKSRYGELSTHRLVQRSWTHQSAEQLLCSAS